MSKKKNNSDEKNVKPSTKEEIEAAVNACYGNPEIKITLPDIPDMPYTQMAEEVDCDKETTCDENSETNENCHCSDSGEDCPCENCKCEDYDKSPNYDKSPDSESSKDKFFADCNDLNICAKDCRSWSDKSLDPSIENYLRGINKKIYNETQNGGYSTTVTIRVVHNDWVNVSHIIDWYKARGFEVLNYRMANSPMNLENGVIEHNFTISWAN